MAQVVLESISKQYAGGVQAVDGVDLHVGDGELLVLVGPSGCGKTTTLRLIAGLERPTAGTIRIAGRVVNDEAPRNRNVAMVFQNPALYPHLNVYGNIAFGLNLRYRRNWLKRAWLRVTTPTTARQLAAEGAEIRPRVRQAAADLGIEALLGRVPGELSGGERQRVALAKAALRKPAVFLFDEPLSSLDAQLRVEMRCQLKDLHSRQGGTAIYVTHDQAEAMTLGDRLAVLDRGRLQQVGTPMELYCRPANRFVAGFLGTPPMNFVSGVVRRIDDGRSIVFFAAGGWQVPLARPADPELLARLDRPIVLGLRPADVRFRPAEAAGEATLSARAAMVETLGDARIVHLGCVDSGSTEYRGPGVGVCDRADIRYIVSTADGDLPIACDTPVQVWFDMRNAHWFDPQSGETIYRQEVPSTSKRPAA